MTTGLTLRDAPSISADSVLTVERNKYTGTSAAVTVASEVSLQTLRNYVVCKVIKMSFCVTCFEMEKLSMHAWCAAHIICQSLPIRVC